MSDKIKADVIKDVYTYNGIKAKEKLGGYESDDDKKIDDLKAKGFSTAQAVLLKQMVNDISDGSNLSKSTKQLQTNFIQGLDLTASQKKALEDVLVSDYQIIYNDTSRAYTSGKGSTNNEDYALSGYGKEANKAWPILKGKGLTLGEFDKIVSVMSNSEYSKKEEKISQLKKLGYSTAQAKTIYGAFKNK